MELSDVWGRQLSPFELFLLPFMSTFNLTIKRLRETNPKQYVCINAYKTLYIYNPKSLNPTYIYIKYMYIYIYI